MRLQSPHWAGRSYRDLANRAALRAESDERKRAVAEERQRREAHLDLLRQQVAGQSAGARADREATLIATVAGFQASANGVVYPCTLRSAGPAVAHGVVVWLEEDREGEDVEVALPRTQSKEVGAVARGDAVALELYGPPAARGVERDALVVASWTDGNGPRLEAIGKARIRI